MLKRPWEPKAILKKKNNDIGIIMLGFKTYNRSIVLKTYRFWHGYRYANPWSRTGDQDILTHMAVLIYSLRKFHTDSTAPV